VDAAALMGYTGAIFKKMFGTFAGYIVSLMLMLAWTVFPFLISLKLFNKKDL
jgi:Cu-processing system permease protein